MAEGRIRGGDWDGGGCASAFDAEVRIGGSYDDATGVKETGEVDGATTAIGV